MRARGGNKQKRAIGPIIGTVMMACIVSPLYAQPQPQPRAPGRQQPQTAPAPAPAPAPPVAAPAPQVTKPALPPLETLDRQERRALQRACAQDWEEMKRVGRASGHHWKKFFESCRINRGSRQ
jgi:hypothetical protein